MEVLVKPERAAEFIAATLENHRGSLGEPGVLRFDVLQSSEDPARTVLQQGYGATPRSLPTQRKRCGVPGGPWKTTMRG